MRWKYILFTMSLFSLKIYMYVGESMHVGFSIPMYFPYLLMAFMTGCEGHIVCFIAGSHTDDIAFNKFQTPICTCTYKTTWYKNFSIHILSPSTGIPAFKTITVAKVIHYKRCICVDFLIVIGTNSRKRSLHSFPLLSLSLFLSEIACNVDHSMYIQVFRNEEKKFL